MTSVDLCFRYTTPPTENCVRALSSLREVYGIRKMNFDSANQTIHLEYDATRLDEHEISKLLLRCGLDVKERVALI